MHPRHDAEGQGKQGTPSTLPGAYERNAPANGRMGECRHTEIPPTLSVEKLEKIKKQTQEKEQADRKQTFRITLYVGLIALFLILLLGIFLR